MKCSNCPNEAVYVYEGSGIKDTPYCVPCLPSFLLPRVKDQTLKTTEAYDEIKSEVLETLTPAEESSEATLTPVSTQRRRRTKTKPVNDAPAEEQAEE